MRGVGMKNLEIYIHIPFCVKKCAYCDFLSAPASTEAQRQYLLALLREIRSFPRKEEYEVVSVFFGGGTPSIWPSDWIEMVLVALHDTFSFVNEPEITIECNPGAARQAGFSNVNIDLMSALPGQTPESWRETLNRVLALQPEHISAYSLIIEEQTPFYEKYHADDERRAKGERPQYLPSEEEEREMYEDTELLLSEAGLYRYEISNYARPGFESRHNTKYWTGEDYLGVGLGASSKIGTFRLKNETGLRQYVSRLNRGETVASVEEILTKEDEQVEFFILGMRCMKGVSLRKYRERFGEDAFARYGKTIQKICDMGLAAREEDRLFLTAKGIDVSNLVFEMFFG